MEDILKENSQSKNDYYQKSEILSSDKFNKYYKDNLRPYFNENSTKEFDYSFEEFLNKLKEKLPCVFRLNQSNYLLDKKFTSILESSELLNKEFELHDLDIKINQIKLYPNNEKIYNINIPRNELRKNNSLKKFHKFIQISVDSGLISRQEAVSMIPPFLLNAKPYMSVLDMCAAPGSKTGQFIEALNYNNNYFSNSHEGYVIANDNNFTRAYMMTHQLQRFNNANFIVVSHDSQVFPRIFNNFSNSDQLCANINPSGERLKFDRILADVPCSGDAVMRKLPHKWKKWSPKDGLSLHKLQISILKRGILLLKDDGLLVYSTCSLNPIENEAVVAEILKEFYNEIEIVDCSREFENTDIKIREGLTNWNVYIDNPNNKDDILLVEKDSELHLNNISHIPYSCFNNLSIENSNELKKCIRIMPHDSDTSGFFIVLLKRKSYIKKNEDEEEKEKTDERKFEIKIKGGAVLKNYGINLIDHHNHSFEINWLRNYYGLRETFPYYQLISHSDKAKKINFVTNGVYKFLKNDLRKQFKIITAGVKLFQQTKNTFKDDDECRYRICQDGILYIIPYLTKHIISVTKDVFFNIIENQSLRLDDLSKIKNGGNEIVNDLKEYKIGCVVVILTKSRLEKKDFEDLSIVEKNFVEAITCYYSTASLTAQVSKEYLHLYSLKYNLKIKSLEDQVYNSKDDKFLELDENNDENLSE